MSLVVVVVVVVLVVVKIFFVLLLSTLMLSIIPSNDLGVGFIVVDCSMFTSSISTREKKSSSLI